MKMRVSLASNEHPTQTEVVITDEGSSLCLVHPVVLRQALALLEAFPYQDLGHKPFAAQIIFGLTNNTIVFGDSDRRSGHFDIFLTMTLDEALKLSLEDLRAKVKDAAAKQSV
jgi:hypothetical protein